MHKHIDLQNLRFDVGDPLLEPPLSTVRLYVMMLSRRRLIRLPTHMQINNLGGVMHQRFLVQVQLIESRFHIHHLQVGVFVLLNLVLHIGIVSVFGLVFDFLEHLRVPRENLIHQEFL